MNMDFHIRAGSINPVLRIELIKDGRYDFKKSLINNALQDCSVKFSMKDVETGILKVSKADANIMLAEEGGCEENYVIEYKWDERDTKKPGIYKGWFEIDFNGNIYEAGVDYPVGKMTVPIQEDLIIYVN